MNMIVQNLRFKVERHDVKKDVPDTNIGTVLMKLPNEILMNIMKYYSNEEVVLHFGPVCKKLFQISCELSQNLIYANVNESSKATSNFDYSNFTNVWYFLNKIMSVLYASHYANNAKMV